MQEICQFQERSEKSAQEVLNSCIGLVVREKTSLIRHARPYCNYGLKVAFIQKSTLYPTDICHSDHEPLWPDNTHSNIRRNIS